MLRNPARWLLVAACSVRQAAPIDALQPIDAVVPDAPICSTCDPNIGLCAPAPIINGSATQVDACATTCAQADGLTEHLEWPDGIADTSGVDWEPMMLDSLAAVN